MEFEHRTTSIELRADVGKRTIFGFANVFGNQDTYGTVFDKGAFRRTIKEKLDAGKIKFLFNHDPWDIVGTLTKLQEKKEGLYYEGHVSDTPLGSSVLTLVQDGALTDNSIGFKREKTTVDDSDEDNPIIHFTQVELFDVSVVTFGANDLAMVEGVRRRETLDVPALVNAVAEETLKRFQVIVPDLARLTEWVQKQEESEENSESRDDDPQNTRAGERQGSDNKEDIYDGVECTRTRDAQIAVRERASGLVRR